MSQREAVLAALRSAPDGLCVSDMNAIDWTAVLTMRNRIHELRQEYVIRGERCRKHAHRGVVSRYWLKEAPASRGNGFVDGARVPAPAVPERPLELCQSVGGAAVDSTAQLALL